MAFLRFPRMRYGAFTPFHAVLLIVVIVTALVLGVARAFRGTQVPTSDVPAVGWEDVSGSEEESSDEIRNEEVPSQPEQDESAPDVVTPPTSTTTPPEEPDTTDSTSVAAKNLAVPFTSQAPTGNWDVVHEDTCEEASLFMVTQYFAGTPAGTLNTTSADNAMLDLVAYEDAHGYGYSVSAGELQAIIADYYDGAYTVTIVDSPTADDIETFVADGYPVIIPAAGRLLGNPFFTGEGPLYHMLVVRGYDGAGGFITNDPGTRHGENYTYTTDVLMNAIHDWNNGDPVNGARRIVVMQPVQ